MVNKEQCVEFTLLGVLRGEIAIFLPGILCILVLWCSDSAMVLGGSTGEFCVRTLPRNTSQKIFKNVARLQCTQDTILAKLYLALTSNSAACNNANKPTSNNRRY